MQNISITGLSDGQSAPIHPPSNKKSIPVPKLQDNWLWSTLPFMIITTGMSHGNICSFKENMYGKNVYRYLTILLSMMLIPNVSQLKG